MVTKTVRSRFSHAVGEKVEGCTILEARVVIPPEPAENRRGVYEYLVEVPPAASPAPGKTRSSRARVSSAPASSEPEQDSFTRATPDEMGTVIRRLPSR